MYNLFISHTPHGVCYLLAKDLAGNIIYKLCITQTAFFELREISIPEIRNESN